MTPETQAALDWCRCAEQDLMRHSDDDASLAACRTAIAALEERERREFTLSRQREWIAGYRAKIAEIREESQSNLANWNRAEARLLEVSGECDALRQQLDEERTARQAQERTESTGLALVAKKDETIRDLRRQLDKAQAQYRRDGTEISEWSRRATDAMARVRDLEAQLSAITVTPEAAEVLELRRLLDEARRDVAMLAENRDYWLEQWQQQEGLQAKLDEERARVERMRRTAGLALYDDGTHDQQLRALKAISAGCPTDSGEEGGQS